MIYIIYVYICIYIYILYVYRADGRHKHIYTPIHLYTPPVIAGSTPLFHTSIYIYMYIFHVFIYFIYLFIYLFIYYITCAKNIHLHIISMYFYGRIKSQKPISQWPLLQADTSPELGGCIGHIWMDGFMYIYICILCGPSQQPTPHPRPHGHGSVCTLYVESLCKI